MKRGARASAPRANHKDGFVLIAVLWILAALAGLVPPTPDPCEAASTALGAAELLGAATPAAPSRESARSWSRVSGPRR